MKKLIIDIETSPITAYVWGLFKQNIAINQIIDTSSVLCFAAKWVGEDEVIFRSSYEHLHEKVIFDAWKLLSEADAVIHYNGNKFDLPVLNREFIQLGLEPPDPYESIDLYQTVKKQMRLASNKLDHVLQELEIGSKVQHYGFQLWVDCMEGDPEAWELMKQYNVGDVEPLEQLYQRLLPWIKNHPNAALYSTDVEERPVCPVCGSHNIKKNGVQPLKTMTYQRYKCNDCSAPIRGRTSISTKEAKANTLVRIHKA